jgi:hypothetical protein
MIRNSVNLDGQPHKTLYGPIPTSITVSRSNYDPSQLPQYQLGVDPYPENLSNFIMDFLIRTPCSSANLGPGFDVIGLALSLYLELRVTVKPTETSSAPLNCVISYEDQSGSAEKISLDPEVNLITRVALYLLRCHDQHAFPAETQIHIVNPIPLSRGLGSSGTAVVAGVILGNEVGKLGLTKERLLDFCLMIGVLQKLFSHIWTAADTLQNVTRTMLPPRFSVGLSVHI